MSPLQYAPSFYRYPDLVARNIVRNRVTLARWQKNYGFPKPVALGPNTRGWIIWRSSNGWRHGQAPACRRGRPMIDSRGPRHASNPKRCMMARAPKVIGQPTRPFLQRFVSFGCTSPAAARSAPDRASRAAPNCASAVSRTPRMPVHRC
jgi:hypothetical protein